MGKIKKLLKRPAVFKKKFIKLLQRLFTKAPKRKFIYAFYYKHTKIDNNAILIESFHGSTISDSSLALAKEILRSHPGKYKIYYGTIDKKKHGEFINATGLQVELIDVNTFHYTKILASAKYLINNSSFPVYFIKRDEQVYLQTWHGTPLKTLGKKMRLGIESMYNVQHNFLQADYITFPNDFTRDALMEDYNLTNLYTGKTVMAGYPRNCVFFDTEGSASLRKKLGLENKTVYAYMPTWRGTSNHDIDTGEYEAEIKGIFSSLDEKLTDNQVFFVNFHPILKGSISLSDYKHIKPFPTDVENYAFLNCADALITDYSSVFFDFSLTKKPIMLFMYDYDEYLHDRGMYLDVATLPFTIIYDKDEFGNALRDESFLNSSYENTDYYKEFFKYDSPDISKKLIDMFLDGNESDLIVTDHSYNAVEEKSVIYPPKLTNCAQLNSIAHIADKNTVVCLEKRWFKGSFGPTLYDNFNDSFDYVVITRTTPRTYFEEFLRLLGFRSIKQKLHLREIKRTFPRLNINPRFIRTYTAFAKNCQVCKKDTASIPITNVETTDKDIIITLDTTNFTISKVAFLEKGKILKICKADFTDESRTSVRLPISEYIESLDVYINKKRDVAFVGYSKKKKRKLLLIPKKAAGNNSSDIAYKFDTPLIRTYTLPRDYYETNLKKLMNSESEHLQKKLLRYDLTPADVTVAVSPYCGKGRKLRLFFAKPENIDSIYPNAKLFKLKTKKNKCTVIAKLPLDSNATLKGMILKYRSSVEDIEIPLEFSYTKLSDCVLATGKIKFTPDMPLKGIYWDIRVVLEKFGQTQYQKLTYKGKFALKFKLFFTKTLCTVDENHVVFPYFAKKSILSFCFRECSEYDTSAVKFKEFVAFGLYKLFGKYLKKQKNWIVFEKFCKMAQDNGYYFFKYCMEQLPREERKHIFYVIDKRSPDYENIKQYGKQVIQFMSIKHMLYILTMNICIASDSKTHLYAWRTTPSIIVRGLRKKKELFLQHGVTALKRVHKLFGKKGSSPMTYFITTGQFEQEIVVSEFKYKRGAVPITGFARWDALENHEDKNDRFILVMPTWRSWLEEVSDEDFVKSDYYQRYISLLKNEKLSKALKDGKTRLVFYIHPKFANYIDNFKSTVSENVSCVPFGTAPLNELMMKCSMLITDYSSVCWDVYYLDKPVLFYQFDYEKYNIAHGSYIDMENDLFGNRSVDEDTLIHDIEHFIDNGFMENEKDREMAPMYFEYRDNDNSKRIYEFLKSKKY